MKSMKNFTSFAVSNNAFSNQMLGQQLLIWLSQELGHNLQGYYKYHKLTVYSTDSHLNHQIFIRKQELIDILIKKAQTLFGATIKLKDIIMIARSITTSDNDADYADTSDTNDYDGEDL